MATVKDWIGSWRTKGNSVQTLVHGVWHTMFQVDSEPIARFVSQAPEFARVLQQIVVAYDTATDTSVNMAYCVKAAKAALSKAGL